MTRDHFQSQFGFATFADNKTLENDSRNARAQFKQAKSVIKTDLRPRILTHHTNKALNYIIRGA